MKNSDASIPAYRNGWKQPATVAAFLAAVLVVLFFRSFNPALVLFSNDGPLGAATMSALQPPASFTGVWYDLNTIGTNGGAWPVHFTGLALWILGPLYYSKFYAAMTLGMLGICAWICFRLMKLSPLACVLGALAAMLGGGGFSTACWGVGSQVINAGMNYLALGLLFDTTAPRRWLRAALAGFAVGMGVMEGADVGAILSVVIAAFVMHQAFVGEGPLVRRIPAGIGRVTLVAICAGLLATQALTMLVGTQIQGVAGMGQDEVTKAQRWEQATQWSLPKREALALVVPGLFGYRMVPPPMDGSIYWGRVGGDPGWDSYFASGGKEEPPRGLMRFSGGSSYVGVLVALVAAWSVAQSFRRKDSVFSPLHRRLLWFWAAAAVVALLLAFGRFAPFYQIVYALPYVSTIRNPTKFLHVLNWAVVVLFTFGIDGLSRRYMNVPAQTVARFGQWWAKAPAFDRRWVFGSVTVLALSFVGWLIYLASRDRLVAYIQAVDYSPAMARTIATFSIWRAAGWFVALLAAAVFLMTLVMRGAFSGPRARMGGVLLGLLLVVDLGAAARPWVFHWDYRKKYATNPILEALRVKPFEHRVAVVPRWFRAVFQAPPDLLRADELFGQLHGIEWAQHHFLYYGIQALDVVQMPRPPQDLMMFDATFLLRSQETLHLPARRWELTNTRYILGAAGWLEVLNQALDSPKQRFRIAQRFDLVLKPGSPEPPGLEDLTAVPGTNGACAVFEFTGALPRVKLYSHWQEAAPDPVFLDQLRTNPPAGFNLELLTAVGTNDFFVLKELADPAFDPSKTVFISSPVPPAPAGTNAVDNPGTVEFSSYAPKRIVLKATAAAPAMLLLNDRYDPNWQVFVDGEQKPLLRANYIMRAVHLTPGPHTVEFVFKPRMDSLYVSLAATVVALGLLAFLVIDGSRRPDDASPPSPPRSEKPGLPAKRP